MTLGRALRFSFIVLVACGFALACGGDESTEHAAAPAVAPTPPAKTPMKAKPGQPKAMPEPRVADQLRVRVSLPDYYPKDAPMYEGAETNKVGWESGRVSAVFTTPDDPSTVSERVQADLRSNGWDEIVEAEMANGVVVQAGKEERGVSALISRMEEGTDGETTMIMVAVDP